MIAHSFGCTSPIIVACVSIELHEYQLGSSLVALISLWVSLIITIPWIPVA
jgi:hypothetical protein